MLDTLEDKKIITNTKSDIQVGKSVLQLEIESLKKLADSLDDDFQKSVNLILNIKGRVIISGMGKSGHIGAKIAATFASTGTPSFFVHPSEASHGDLGMITEQDCVICLSNSGATQELNDLINYTRRFHIPLIAFVAKRNSPLGDAADIILCIPNVKEACPNGLAPTTSTTTMLALGDAIAVTLMKKRNFSADDFGKYHPGGKLGTRLLKVENIMNKGDKIPLINANASFQNIIDEIGKKNFGATGVIDDSGTLIGVITDGDLRRRMSIDIVNKRAFEIMTPNPIIMTADTIATKAVSIIEDRKITCLFIIDDTFSKKPIGILHIHDCLKAGII